MFQQCLKGMEEVDKENPNAENPFLLACNQMFKDFEKETGANEGENKAEDETFMNML